MEKRVINEQWYVKILINKINNTEINKPKFQRKKNGIFYTLEELK